MTLINSSPLAPVMHSTADTGVEAVNCTQDFQRLLGICQRVAVGTTTAKAVVLPPLIP
ncbi:MAG: hypothetical protein Q8N96_07285 [Methylovulum sp.]|nr:hypothetical protein [Methylovulum sp.]